MLKTKIAITSIASFSALGKTSAEVWNEYLSPKTLIVERKIGDNINLVAPLSETLAQEVQALRNSDVKYKSLDNSVLYAILASREAIKKANWSNTQFGVNIGSSRGATQLFEKHHKEFLESGKTPTLASPTTTLGNISTWVAHDLKSKGPELSHSITCSTALHALLNGIAWLQAGMADKFLVGGSEAPLTAFTIAQMQALKIYAPLRPFDSAQDRLAQCDNDKGRHNQDKQCQSEPACADEGSKDFPCRALDLDKTKNSMVLGEGAAMACLEIGEQKNALGYITGFGYATDDLQHSISITDEAECFQKSMKMALQNVSLDEVDVIVMHAPGTIKGDKSEYKAIQKVFGKNLPMLTTNKWKVGHTFGASGMLNVEMALLMMQHQQFIGVPYSNPFRVSNPERVIKNVLVNAVGFGGNAVSILIGTLLPSSAQADSV